MTHPTIHPNGTGIDTLRDAFCKASCALANACDALRQAAPNARDYHVQTNGVDRGLDVQLDCADAFETARTEHSTRLSAIDVVKAEIDALAIGLDDKPEGGE